MQILITIGVSFLITLISVFGLYNYASIGEFTHLKYDGNFGAITELATTDSLSDFPTTYNANLGQLMRRSTTTLYLLASSTNLVSVGALSSGSLATGFTAVTVPLGGTGSSTLATGQILLGSTTNAVGIVGSWGTSGQFLTSGGDQLPPTWTTSSVDQTLHYYWSGSHTFTGTSTTFSVSTTTISSATTTLTATDGVLGIATSTPWLLMGGVSIGTDVYIDSGGMGIGISTTTDDNLEVAGDIVLGGEIYVGLTATSGTQALGTADTDDVTHTIGCEAGYQMISGGYSFSSGEDADRVIKHTYRSNATTWSVNAVCGGASCAANNLTVHGLCGRIY